MWAKLAVNGYPLYRETKAVQSPLFLETLGLAFRLAGQTVQAGRGAMLSGFGLLAVSLSWLAYRNRGWPSALATLMMLSISPLAFTFSRLAMAEFPATALAVTSLALLLHFIDTEQRVWCIASGLMLGLSFITKPLNPFIIVPMAIVLISHFYNKQESQKSILTGENKIFAFLKRKSYLMDILWWSLGLVVPFIAVLLVYDPRAMYDQLVLFRSDLRDAIPGSFAETAAQFEIFIHNHWGIWLLAVGGVAVGSRKYNIPDSLPTSYLLAGCVMLCWHTPLFAHHFIVLLPPLILLASELISEFITPHAKTQNNFYIRLLTGLLIAVAAFNIPAMLKANQQAVAVVTGGREQQALDLLRAVSQPADMVMGDSQLLIFMADRSTPPDLGDLALVGIKAKRQTSARLIDLTTTTQAAAVVQWSLRLPWLPEYLDWVQANYLARRVWDNDHIIYFVPRWPSSRPLPNEQTSPLGKSLQLRGYQLEPSQIKNTLNLKIYWQTTAPLTKDYTVFIQLLDHNGKLVVGRDSQPLSGYFPTRQWPPNEIITDLVHVPLPPDLPTGDYTLITGMYLLDTLERLPTPTGDYVTLTSIKR